MELDILGVHSFVAGNLQLDYRTDMLGPLIPYVRRHYPPPVEAVNIQMFVSQVQPKRSFSLLVGSKFLLFFTYEPLVGWAWQDHTLLNIPIVFYFFLPHQSRIYTEVATK